MKSFTLNRKSWHYRLVKKLDLMMWVDEESFDFCAYLRKVLFALIICALIAAMAALIVGLVGNLLAWIASVIFIGYTTPNEAAKVMIITVGVSSCAFAGWSVVKYFRNRAYEETSTAYKEPGFAKLAYRKFKDKTCFTVKFEG